ncbi:MAG: TAT-variant-translocated molybdopterin oxidoreductase [Planctomycetes bacterium]|nr:TAT-variant-translocated molybdopterin oxidoreductase [Planctomycetota bacterium]
MTDLHVSRTQPTPAGSAPAEKRYWRSFDDLARTPEFVEALSREFPEGAAEHSGLADPVSRRKFLGVVAAGVALAGMTSCRKPGREILPYTHRPEGLIPGLPQHYASVHARHGYGIGTLVRSHTGRPTKVEGNRDHPGSLGGTDSFMQAELLQLYDPARSQHVLHRGDAGLGGAGPVDAGHGGGDGHGGSGHGEPGAEPQGHSVAELLAEWGPKVRELAASDEGAGVRVLMPPTSSPTMARLLDQLAAALPKAKVVRYTPLDRDAVLDGAKLATGRDVDAQYDFGKAKVVASFDADFLGLDAPTLAWTRSWADSQRVRKPGDVPARLYVAESCHTVTGSNADHRFPLSDGEIADAVFALAVALDAGGPEVKAAVAARGGQSPRFVGELAADLRANRGAALVVVGPRQPAAVHACAHAINLALGAAAPSGPLSFTDTPTGLRAHCREELRQLVNDLRKGAVKALIVLGGNPVYDAPADLGFAQLYKTLSRDGTTIHLGLHVDETAQVSTWHVPLAHELESWGDLLAYDGTAAICQPLISPLYPAARSPLELLAALIEHPETEGYALVQETWRDSPVRSGTPFEDLWRSGLTKGVIAGTAAARVEVSLRAIELAAAISATPVVGAPTAASLEIGFRASPNVFDGRYANNAWMQEQPSPLEKLTWDNAALMSRATAETLGVFNDDVVELTLDGRTVQAPVWIQPGHAPFAITLTIGYGRRLPADCEVAAERGYDACALRSSSAWSFGRGATLKRTGETWTLASTQDHGVMEGRPLVREATVEEFRARPDFAKQASPAAQTAALEGGSETDLLKSLWTERDYSTGHQWGMVIDLNTCTGCGACVTACVAENNIPMVGKEQVLRGREMHWNRIDRYFTGEATQDGVPLDAEPRVMHQMVPCMQCENAPCESVCPVGATMHSPDGLNDMAYNRCIGTRYCNNNCPFKVRRFNWFNFHKNLAPTTKLQFNPDVTIRHRGVMEKCTYCTQRINGARFQAKLAGRTLRDGDIVTACEQACPAQAIVFGDINDPQSRVTQLRGNTDRATETNVAVDGSPLNYAMLSEYNLKPRTSYLAKVRNPNPKLS